MAYRILFLSCCFGLVLSWCRPGAALATVVPASRIAESSADGSHSAPHGPENVLDGDPETGWVTAQRNMGSGWGRHWIMLTFAAPVPVQSVTLLGAQNAYARATYDDAQYRLELRGPEGWTDLGSQTVPASLEQTTADLVFTLDAPLPADAVRVWATWNTDRDVPPKADNDRMRYCSIADIRIEGDVTHLADVTVSELFQDDDILVAATLAGSTDDHSTYHARLTLASIRTGDVLTSQTFPLSPEKPDLRVRAKQLALPDDADRELVLTVALMQGEQQLSSQRYQVRSRGRVFSLAAYLTERPGLQPGDSILIEDLSRFVPQDAIRDHSEPGSWWRRAYSTADGDRGHLLSVVARDPEHPERCLVPTLRLPLDLRGSFEIWAIMPRTYRGAGVDVCLDGDDSWHALDTMAVSRYPGGPDFTNDCMVELFWNTRTLNGEDLLVRQPHGTTYSFPLGFCEAHIAGFRLVRVSDAAYDRRRQSLRDAAAKRVIVNNDGHGIFWQWGQEDFTEYYRWVDALADQSVKRLELCVISTGAFNYLTEVADTFGDGLTDADLPRIGDKRIAHWIQHYKTLGLDPLEELIARGRQAGVPVYPSLRMNAFYSGVYARMFNGPFWRANPDLRLPGSQRLNYAEPEVRDYVFRILQEILNRFDVDGLSLDFTRHPPFFPADAADRESLMTALLQRVRDEADRVGAQRGKRIELSVTFHGNSYRRDGLDVEAWVKKGIVDCICPQLAPFKQKGWSDPTPFVEMADGTSCQVFGRIEHIMGGHDPRPSENDKMIPVREHRGPKDYEQLMAAALDAGLDGIYTFNQNGQWPSMRRLGLADEVRRRAVLSKPFGIIEGPVITMEPPRTDGQ